jgi:hypothetical protein
VYCIIQKEFLAASFVREGLARETVVLVRSTSRLCAGPRFFKTLWHLSSRDWFAPVILERSKGHLQGEISSGLGFDERPQCEVSQAQEVAVKDVSSAIVLDIYMPAVVPNSHVVLKSKAL